MPTLKPTTPSSADRAAWLSLLVLALAARVPFFHTFAMVTYDGTSYLWEAQALQVFHRLPGTFPIGYPAAAALFQLVLRDWVLAGRMVSLVAGVGSTLLLYRLARDRAGVAVAVTAAAVLTLNPLFIRLTLETMSESLYIFLLFLSLYLLMRRHALRAGLSLGAAAATRPEALAVAGVVALSRARVPRRLALIAVGVAGVVALNAAVLSLSQGQLILLSKAGWLGSATRSWKAAERSIDFELPEGMEADTDYTPPSDRGLVAEYLYSMPRELWLLARHTWPAVILLALWGMWRTGWSVYLAPLVPLFFFTLFTKRQEDRYILPYIPFLVLYAGLGAGALRKSWARYAALAAMAACAVALLVVQRAELTVPDEPALQGMKVAGEAMRDRVRPGDRAAGRKPYFAFYAGARYVEIPVAPYEELMENLTATGVEWLSLHRETIDHLRPALRPLMYSKAVINGELRFDQVYFHQGGGTGEMVFHRALDADPLRWTQLTSASKADFMPAWSSDGERIAFRRQHEDGTEMLAVASRRNRVRPWSADNMDVSEVAVLDDARDPLAWSSDGERIAFARRHTGERTDLALFAVDVLGGDIAPLVDGPGDDRSPSWPAPGRLIYDRATDDGRHTVWLAEPGRPGATGPLTDRTDCVYPVASPDGSKVAWVTPGTGVAVLDVDTGAVLQMQAPHDILYAPAWSPDGTVIAVGARDWGSWDIYLLAADGSNVLLLTKRTSSEATPAWSPDGTTIVLTSQRDEKFSLWAVDTLGPYLARLSARVRMDTFSRIP